MSSTQQPRDRRGRRGNNPATATVEELLTHPATASAAYIAEAVITDYTHSLTRILLHVKDGELKVTCM